MQETCKLANHKVGKPLKTIPGLIASASAIGDPNAET